MNKIRLTGSYTDRFVCECGYVATNKTSIRLHLRTAHGDGTETVLRECGAERQCKVCMETFNNGPQLIAHVRHAGHIQR